MSALTCTDAAPQVDILGAQQDAPLGCAVDVADGVEVHLMIKGLVDVATEVAKLEKTTASLKAKIDKATALLASDGAAKMKPEALADKQDKLENVRVSMHQGAFVQIVPDTWSVGVVLGTRDYLYSPCLSVCVCVKGVGR